MKKAIMCLFLVIFISSLNAQENTIEIPNIHTLHSIHRINDTVDFVIARMNSQDFNELCIFKLDKSLNSIDSLSSFFGSTNNQSIFINTKDGLAFTTGFYEGNSWVNKIHWLGADGQSVSTVSYNSPKILSVHEDFVYFSIPQSSNMHQIIRINRFSGQTEILATTNKELLFEFPDEDEVYFAARNLQGYLEVLKFQEGLGLQTVLGSNIELPIYTLWMQYEGKYENDHYIRSYANQQVQFWQVNLDAQTVFSYGSIPSSLQYNMFHQLPDTTFYTQTWENVPYDFAENYLLKGSLNSSQLDTVYYSQSLAPYRPRIDFFSDKKYVKGYSYKHGYEPFYIADSVYLLSDLAPEIRNSWAGGYYCRISEDSSLAIMTNHNDDQLYLYGFNDTFIESYFPVISESSMSATRFFDNTFYWFYFFDNRLIIKYRTLLENLSPQPLEAEDVSNETWSRNLYYVSEAYWSGEINNPKLSRLKLLNDGSVIAGVRQSESFRFKIVDEQYKIIDDAYGGFVIYKLDSVGKLVWHHSSGAQFFGSFASYPIIWDMDSNGDIYMTGSFFEDYYFEDDTISVDRCANFLIKIDGQTGEKIWFKLISETFYYGDFQIDQMKIYNDEIYFTYSYTGFSCIIDGVTLTNSWSSPINALAKFDLNGNLIFAKNIPTDWTDRFGKTWILDFEDDNMVAIQAQGAYNTSSSCEFRDWGYYNQILDTQGNINDVVSIYSSDLGSARCGFLRDNEIYSFGYYRGTLDLDYFEYTTPPQNNCNANRGFMYRYNIVKGFKELKMSNNPFFPFAAQYFGENYYVYGRGDNNELMIVKFDANGLELGYKPLGQYIEELTFEAYQQFDVNDDFITVIGDRFKENAEYFVPKPVSLQSYVTIIKTRNDNWLNDKKIFKNVPRNIPEIHGDNIIVYPNPSDGIYNLMFENPIYDEVQVYDVSGHLVFSMTLNDDEIQTIDLHFLAQGIYMLRLLNSEESRTIRVMKN